MIKSKRMGWTRHVAQMGEGRIWVGRLEGMRPLGRQSCRWVYNIKMDLGEIVWGGVEWIDLAQDRDQWMTCEQGNKPFGCIKMGEVLGWLHNWRSVEKGSTQWS
jgi:hypothetical protein